MHYQRGGEAPDEAATDSTLFPDEAEAVEEGHLTIFSRVALSAKVKALVGAAHFEAFSQPLVNRSVLKDKVGFLERLLGCPSAQATAMADEIITDMQLATDYPPYYEGVLLPPEAVVPLANTLLDYVTSLEKDANSEDF